MVNKENSSPLTKESLAKLWKEYQDLFESEEEFFRTVAVWPVCPECGRRREVSCPVCHRVRSLFPPADDDFWFGSDDPVSVGSTASCGCRGGENCGSKDIVSTAESVSTGKITLSESSELIPRGNGVGRRPTDDFAASAETSESCVWEFSEPENDSAKKGNFSAASDSIYTAKTFSVTTPYFHRSTMETLDMTPEKKPSTEDLSRKFQKEGLRLVVCPTCDEPFVPKYLPFCKGCGHRFDDSVSSAVEEALSEADDLSLETDGGRVALMAVGMVIVAILFVLFLIFFIK